MSPYTRRITTEDRVKRLDDLNGYNLKAALSAGTLCLQRYSKAINALNVFPVPDGDTGTNMLLTMRSVEERLQAVDSKSISTVAQEAAHGALLGARGNSGVIFSQFLTGFAKALNGTESCDPATLAQALASGSEASYMAVSQPVEGTMLTIMREFSAAAKDQASQDKPDVISLWTGALKGARVALEQTTFLLPVLRDAGVVDSGGQSVVVIMEGFLCSFLGENIERFEVELSRPTGNAVHGPPTVSEQFIQTTQSERYGFCTEFIINGTNIHLADLRSNLTEMGTSMIVVGDSSLAKVHIHTFNPDGVLRYGATFGRTSKVKIDDIDQEHQGFVALHSKPQQSLMLAAVSVAWGDGFANLFHDLGCHAVVSCGLTMNPSAKELLDAAQSTQAKEVVILPNNPNVILTAQQACAISPKGMHFIPTSTIPQGIAAMLSYTPEFPPEQVLRAMKRSVKDIKTLEVTTAVRETVMAGILVKQGQVIGLLDGSLVATGSSILGVLQKGILKAEPPEDGVITLYWGGDTEKSEALEAAERLRSSLPEREVEVVYGGQPLYHYVASIE